MPALFPYMVLSQLLASGVSAAWLTPVLAMLGGSPAGARLIAQQGDPVPRAQRLAALCATASPLFILGTLQGGIPMLAAHWLGALAAYGFVRLLQKKEIPMETNSAPTSGARSTLPEAIRDASLAMVTVCGCMALFSALSALTAQVLPLSGLPSALLLSVLEMAGGCAKIQGLGLSPAITGPLLCAAVSFGGLSVFLQNAVFLKGAGINLRIQLAARIVHAGAAYALCALLMRLPL